MNLKELFGKLSSDRGLIIEDIEWENEGRLDSALAVTCRKAPGGYVIEESKVCVKTIAGDKWASGYRILEVRESEERDTGMHWTDYQEVTTVRGEYNVVEEIVALFARNNVNVELECIQNAEIQQLAKEWKESCK